MLDGVHGKRILISLYELEIMLPSSPSPAVRKKRSPEAGLVRPCALRAVDKNYFIEFVESKK